MSRHVAQIVIGEDFIADILHLPKGVRVRGMWTDNSSRTVRMLLEPVPGRGYEAWFPPVQDGEEAPIIDFYGTWFPDHGYDHPAIRIELRFRWWFFGWCRDKWAKIKAKVGGLRNADV
ncbi:MAG: hypothetical protein ACYSWO_29205 [Planctomycetota bacterium]|jgi:hypothetical protein